MIRLATGLPGTTDVTVNIKARTKLITCAVHPAKMSMLEQQAAGISVSEVSVLLEETVETGAAMLLTACPACNVRSQRAMP